jgi:hypothetical protein
MFRMTQTLDMLDIMKRAIFTIRTGSDADWPALGRAVADLQDFERAVVGYPLLPGSEVWQDYLADLRRRLTDGRGDFSSPRREARLSACWPATCTRRAIVW